jgi:hypothetical protein
VGGRPLAAGPFVIARGACIALVSVLAVPAWAAAQARTDSDPTRPILFSVRPEFYRIADGPWRGQVIARYDQAMLRNRRWLGGKRGLLLRAEVPIASADAAAVQRASGLGDSYAQVLLIPHMSGRFALAAGTGLVMPTATSSVLGGGRWTLAPTVAAVWFLRGVGLAHVIVQDYVSVAGDARRLSTHFLRVTPTFIRSVGRQSWILLDTETKTDWRSRQTVVKSGVQFGHLQPGGVGLWIKPELSWGDRAGDWTVKTGIVWYR